VPASSLIMRHWHHAVADIAFWVLCTADAVPEQPAQLSAGRGEAAKPPSRVVSSRWHLLSSASNVLRAALVSLWIWIACTIWITPRIISDAPGNQGQHDDGIERPNQHDGAGDQRHHAEHDIPAPPGRSRSPSANRNSPNTQEDETVRSISDSSKTA